MPGVRPALAALLAIALSACAPLYTAERELTQPRPEAEWRRLVEDVRAYQKSIGFEPTQNFQSADEVTQTYTFCGHGSRLHLPYSYQDPAIRWTDAQTEEECRASGENMDVTFAVTEAIAGVGTPVTRKMLMAPLSRFLYLVLHDDCHEQFALPYGIEEALCNMLAYAGMEKLAEDRFRDDEEARLAIGAFARAGARRADFTVALYEEVAALYTQHDGARMSPAALLESRGEIFRSAAQQLAQREDAINNVWLATAITYTRHYRLMRRVLDTFGGDLARTVAFFRRVDTVQADRASFGASHGCGHGGIAFVRAYEAGIVKVIEQALDSQTPLDAVRQGDRVEDSAEISASCRQAAAEARLERAPRMTVQKKPAQRDF